MLNVKTLRLFCLVLVLLGISTLVACGAYLRIGTDVLSSTVSPDGKWNATIMVRNGGAMTGYVTVVSVTRNNWIRRELTPFLPTVVFAADNNNGAVVSGKHGEIAVTTKWQGERRLAVSYSEQARVFKNAKKVGAVSVEYSVTQE